MEVNDKDLTTTKYINLKHLLRIKYVIIQHLDDMEKVTTVYV